MSELTDHQSPPEITDHPEVIRREPHPEVILTDLDPEVSGSGPDAGVDGSRATRRTALLAGITTVVAAACAPPTPAAPPAPPVATTPPPPPPPVVPVVPATASMVVNRLTFGARPGLVAQVQAMGIGAWIDQQLAPASLPNAESRVASYQTLNNTNKQNYDVQATDGGQDLLFDELDHASILRATYSERQLYEVMCDFWANHFNTWRRHTWMGFLKTRDLQDVVRANALGKFSDLLTASTHSPAMLDYLDNLPNDASTPGGVNENYAREVMELHTLGIINGQQSYTEADVAGVARIVSGWALDWTAGPNQYNFKFLPWQHSLSAVSVLGGAFSRPARTYGQGYDDGVTLFNVLAHHPSTAKYIAWKLCRRFVSDDPPMSLVNSAAAVFSANDTAIVPVLRHIFTSNEFAASAGSKVRRPLDHVIACFRALNAQFGNDAQGHAANTIRYRLDDLNQPLHERPTPDGYPDIVTYWVGSEGMLQRWEVAGLLAQNWFTDQGQSDKIVVSLTALLPSPLPATVADLVTWIATNIANIALPAGDVTDLCAAIGFAGTAAASTLVANASRLALTFGLILSHPAFQRR